MKTPTSESILNIRAQVSEFCNELDPVLKPALATLALLSYIEDLEMESTDEAIQYFEKNPIQELTFNPDIFKTMSLQMNEWFNGWLTVFKESVEKEDNLILKNEHQSDIFFYQSMIDKFNFVTSFFIENSIIEFDKLNTLIKRLHEVKEEHQHSNDLDYDFGLTVNDAMKCIKRIEQIIENMRTNACTTRQTVNEEIKVRTKIQLIRINNTTFIDYLKDKKIAEYNALSYSAGLNYKKSISRRYFD